MEFNRGDRVRVHKTSFGGATIPDFYFEGIVIGPDEIFSDIYQYKIDKVMLPLYGDCPHSWKIGTLGGFNTTCADGQFVELLPSAEGIK